MLAPDNLHPSQRTRHIAAFITLGLLLPRQRWLYRNASGGLLHRTNWPLSVDVTVARSVAPMLTIVPHATLAVRYILLGKATYIDRRT